jgi:hypothetical protein
MEWLFLIVQRKDVAPGETVSMTEMQRYAAEIAREGKVRGGAPLHDPKDGARVEVRDGRATVTDGPFAETKEVVSGYFAIDAATREEALALARRCPALRSSSARVEVRAAPDRDVVGPVDGTKYMLLLHMSPDLEDPDGAGYREMIGFDNQLKRESAYVESASLPADPRPARIETRAGAHVVIDGPFVESKEIVGGYYVIAAQDREAALAIAARCPHARWGPIEVREVMQIGGPS